jgi:hypothetical protein
MENGGWTDEQLYAVYETTFDEVRQAVQLSEAKFLLDIGAGLARRPPTVRRAALRAYCDAVRGGPKRSMRHLLAAVRAA